MQLFKKKHLPERSLDEIKQLVKILFIDDVKFDVVDTMKDCGWLQIKRIKDIDNLDHPDIQDTHIFFVDIQGVGKKLSFSDEGLGLAKAIKEKYPSKSIILYSAQTTGDRFHKTLSIVDATIRKNADTYEFLKLAEKYSKQAFCLTECLLRIQKTIKKETGTQIEIDKIEKDFLKLHRRNNINSSKLASIYNLSTSAADLLSVILNTYIGSN